LIPYPVQQEVQLAVKAASKHQMALLGLLMDQMDCFPQAAASTYQNKATVCRCSVHLWTHTLYALPPLPLAKHVLGTSNSVTYSILQLSLLLCKDTCLMQALQTQEQCQPMPAQRQQSRPQHCLLFPSCALLTSPSPLHKVRLFLQSYLPMERGHSRLPVDKMEQDHIESHCCRPGSYENQVGQE